MKTDRSLKEFLVEAEDILETANQTLLAIENGLEAGSTDPDRVNALFRSLHSFKGLAGMFGLQTPADLAHKLEFLLDELRLGRVSLTPGVLDVLTEMLGLLGQLVVQISRKQQPDDITAALERIDGVLHAGPAASADRSLLERVTLDRSILSVLTEYEEYRLKENIRARKNLFLLKATFDIADFEKGIKQLSASLKKFGELICTLPTAGESVSGIGFTMVVGTAERQEKLKAAIKLPGLAIETVPYREVPRAAEPRSAAGELKSASNSVRVDIAKLDSLMGILGEIHISKSAFGRIAGELRAMQGFTGLAVDLHKIYRRLERKLNELQEGILDVRMVPMSQIFTRLAQAVKKYARGAGKEVNLLLEGEETELDKLMIEDLADPLMHMIRNAIDHGIEAPDVRTRQGKPERGTVQLTAFPKGNHVVVTVEDDGAGIDPRVVLAKAVEKGIIEAGHGLDPLADRKEILDLIFLPGFTTSEQVTEISGRGVGMDVVKKNVSKLSGIIDIETETGAGTRFTIMLPITLAIIKALVIEAGGQIFTIPLNSVLETIRVSPERIETVETREVMAVRDETIPLIRLSQVFNLTAERDRQWLYVILVGLAERRLGIVVDGFRGQQEIIIKPLGKRLSNIPGIAGATDLGDKRMVLVLDVESLIGGTMKKAAGSRQ
ncbi:MAG: chemotaxis protein CheA [Nitrospirota bacterium]